MAEASQSSLSDTPILFDGGFIAANGRELPAVQWDYLMKLPGITDFGTIRPVHDLLIHMLHMQPGDMLVLRRSATD